MKKAKQQLIAYEVIRVLKTKFEDFPDDTSQNRNAPFHEAFLKAFEPKLEQRNIDDAYSLISLSSWLHGLNTTLGQTFFENAAHILSDGEKRTFKDNKICEGQQRVISEIITDLKNKSKTPDLNRENELIFLQNINSAEVSAPDFTVDNLVITNDYIEAIELKSVHPNAGEMRGEKQKILNGKAVLKKKFDNKKIRYFIGFPFDPLNNNDTGHNKERFMKSVIELEKFFHEEEILLADQLWDKLNGEKHTMREILDIINTISTSEFIDKFNFINDPVNFENDNSKYVKILEEWYMFDEIKIFDKYDILKNKYPKIFYQTLFKENNSVNGKYNNKRKDLLSVII